jgi:hypothetical protein
VELVTDKFTFRNRMNFACRKQMLAAMFKDVRALNEVSPHPSACRSSHLSVQQLPRHISFQKLEIERAPSISSAISVSSVAARKEVNTSDSIAFANANIATIVLTAHPTTPSVAIPTTGTRAHGTGPLGGCSGTEPFVLLIQLQYYSDFVLFCVQLDALIDPENVVMAKGGFGSVIALERSDDDGRMVRS